MTSSPSRPAWPRGVPPALLLAVVVTMVEAAVLVVNGLVLLTALSAGRLALGLTSAGFFVLYGAFVGFCAWRVLGGESWARSPLVMAQLIQILIGVSFWGGRTTPVAIALVLCAVVVLAGLFHRSSMSALAEE